MLVAHSLNSKAKIHISLHFFSKNDDFSIVFFKKKTNLNVFTQSIRKPQATRLSKSRNALFKQKNSERFQIVKRNRPEPFSMCDVL